MKQLLLVNLIWAFSFSLIGHYVSGKVDTYLGIFIRLALGFLFWAPFLSFKKEMRASRVFCMLIGAIQIGCMYLAYYNSFKYLEVAEVALFTITTPLYISFFSGLLERKMDGLSFAAAIGATLGACIIKWNSISPDFMFGFLLVQIANSCFALGQVLYRKYLSGKKFEKSFFAYFYLGAIIPILPFLSFRWSKISWQIPMATACTLLWLGLVASGLAYYLWNSGTRLVSSGQLAVLNNVLIPLAIMINVLLWSAKIDWPQFLLGSSIIVLSLYISKRLHAVKQS